METRQVKLSDIVVDPSFNVRKYLKKTGMESIEELAKNIKANGLINPPMVTEDSKGAIRLVSGFRRVEALKLLAKKPNVEITVTVTSRVGPEDEYAINFAENVSRKDLTPFEIAQGVKRYMSKFESTQEKVAARVGLSRSYVGNLMTILEKVHPDILKVWANPEDSRYAKLGTDFLRRLANFERSEQWEQFLEGIGEKPAKEGEEGAARGPSDKPRSPGQAKLKDCLEAVKKSDRSMDWKAGAVAALKFAMGLLPEGILGVYDATAKKEKNGTGSSKGSKETQAEV